MSVKVKKVIIIVFLLVIVQGEVVATDSLVSSQFEELNLSSLIQEGQKYTKESFPDVDVNELLTSALSGDINNKVFFLNGVSLLGKEVISAITLLASILVIVVIHSILKTIAESLESTAVSQIAYYVTYILIVTLIMVNFTSIISNIKETIANASGYMSTLVPILLALMITTGNAVSASFIQPVILFSIVFIGNMINLIVLPVTIVATVLGIVSNLSDKIQIGKLAKFMKSSITWVLGFVVTIFVGALSLEGTLTSSVDGITVKGIKAATSTFVPILGKALGDSVDTVLGATSVIKNAIGIVGIIIIIGICLLPIIKLTVLTLLYNFTSAVCEPLADKKIVSVIEQIGGTFKLLLAIMVFVAVLFIIGVAIILKLSNSGMMYR